MQSVVSWEADKQSDESMPESKLNRISELRDYSIRLCSQEAYFRTDDDKLSDPHKRRFFADIERDLQALDTKAWALLRCKAFRRLTAKRPYRGWEPFFETLNEARGYNHLVESGCTSVEFIPEQELSKTPDLQAFKGAEKILCEVKTINISENEARRRAAGGVLCMTDSLENGFLFKLKDAITKADSQTRSFDVESNARRRVHVVINFDDMLHEYAGKYEVQIRAFLKTSGPSGPKIEIYLDARPPSCLSVIWST